MRLHVRGKRFVVEGELGGVGSDGRVLVCVHAGLDIGMYISVVTHNRFDTANLFDCKFILLSMNTRVNTLRWVACRCCRTP